MKTIHYRLQLTPNRLKIDKIDQFTSKTIIEISNGYHQLATRYFTCFPPREEEVEQAINLTEETIVPFKEVFSDKYFLYCQDDWFNKILQLSFKTIKDDQGNHGLSTDELESVFNRLAELIKGLPLSQDILPENKDFAAYLLVIRELAHHWRIKAIFRDDHQTKSIDDKE